jgi:hypothetical protein
MKLTPQQALDLLNGDAAKMFRSPLANDIALKAASTGVERFVQIGLDAMLERAEIDARVQFSVNIDPKTGTFMAFLKGSF